jgi:hypothetical protein
LSYIRYTEKADINGAPIKGFPLIFDQDGHVNRVALCYFIEQSNSIVLGSLRTYARHLNDFFTQLEIDFNEVSFKKVNEDYLYTYEKALINREEWSNKKSYVSQIFRTVLHYCDWLEEKKYERNLIGTSSQYRIRIKKSDKGEIKHKLSKKPKDKEINSAPRTEWIESIKKHGPKKERVNARFELMIDWGRRLGLRAFEVCVLTIKQLPKLETAEKAIANEHDVYITLTVTKGGLEKKVSVSSYCQIWCLGIKSSGDLLI